MARYLIVALMALVWMVPDLIEAAHPARSNKMKPPLIGEDSPGKNRRSAGEFGSINLISRRLETEALGN